MLIVYYCHALNQCICNPILRVPPPTPQMTEYLKSERALSVRQYVCICPGLQLKNIIAQFWSNLEHIILAKIWDDTFFQILGNIALLTSWWPFCLFLNAALSWPQFCYYLFQTNKVESRLSRFGIENKNRSVNNSRPKKQTSFTKNRLLGFQAGVRGPEISPRLWSGKSFATTICWCCDDCYDSKIIWKV